MSEPTMDSEDQALNELFSTLAVEDDGFSSRVVSRLRRRLWMRRSVLPAAILLGLAIAGRPALELLTYSPDSARRVTAEFVRAFAVPLSHLSGLSLVVMAAVLATIVLTVADEY